MPDGSLFQWYAHQQRAVETVIYLYEVERVRRVEDIARVAGLSRVGQRDPWPKLGLQLATGAGKTKVMSLLMTWAHLHWQLDDPEAGLGFGGTQLLIAPNLIVLERLLTDFRDGAIFAADPLIPPELRSQWGVQVITADSVPGEWRPGEGYLVVANVQKLFAAAEEEADEDGFLPPQLALFERPAPTQLDLGIPRLVEFLRAVRTPIAVYNDEAHHVHDEATHYADQAHRTSDRDTQEAVAWHGVLARLTTSAGLALQTDMSATLYEEASHQWFRHTVYNYPLSRAVADGVVKQPYLAKVQLRYTEGRDDPIPLIDDAATDAWDKYTQLIQAGIAEWKKEQRALDEVGLRRKVILFIVCNTKSEAHQVATRLEAFADPDTGEVLFAGKVTEIHIGVKEGTNEREWEKIRNEVRRIDDVDNPYTAVVSVMMLKEGWDVRNVKVIVPLRPCDSRTLTEQLLGRGLRRMFPPYWSPEGDLRDQGIHEGLYVIRHPSFAQIINQIQDIVTETDAGQRRHDPTRIVINPVEPEEERARRDLPIAQVVSAPDSVEDWPERINRQTLPPLPQRFTWGTSLSEVEGLIRHSGIGGTASPEAEVRYRVQTIDYASIDKVISTYAEAVRQEQRVARYFESVIKGIIKAYLERATFALPPGVAMNLDDAATLDEEGRKIVLANIQAPAVKTAVIAAVARIVGEARAGRGQPAIQFVTRRAMDLPAFEAVPRLELRDPRKCVFAACCFDSPDERRLAELLDEADDVAAWLWNDQQGVGFRIQYTFEGKTPYYYPDRNSPPQAAGF